MANGGGSYIGGVTGWAAWCKATALLGLRSLIFTGGASALVVLNNMDSTSIYTLHLDIPLPRCDAID